MNRRKTLLLLAGVAMLPRVRAADAPLLREQDPLARQHQYLADAAHSADPSHNCANCALYQGASGNPSGPCLLFSGVQVLAAGTCKDWAPQI